MPKLELNGRSIWKSERYVSESSKENDKRWFQAYYDEDNDGFKRDNDGDFW